MTGKAAVLGISLGDLINGGIFAGVLDFLVFLCAEDLGVCVGGLLLCDLGYSVNGELVYNAEHACDDSGDEEEDGCKLKYLFHYAFASFAAFLAALRSSLVTPN